MMKMFNYLKKIFSFKNKSVLNTKREHLRDILLLSDVDLASINEIIDKLDDQCSKDKSNIDKYNNLAYNYIKKTINQENDELAFYEDKLNVIMLIGYNGSGKTTTTAKLANLLKNSNKTVALACCDTFRAAAKEQLNYWSNKLDIKMIYNSNPKTPPSSIAYNAVEYALDKKLNYLLIDTAGRQHNDDNLMKELLSINNVFDKFSNINVEKILILDANLASLMTKQLDSFSKYNLITGICVTKLDGSSKAGNLIRIRKKYDYPIYFSCNGEKIMDISNFDIDRYIKKLLVT